MLHPMQLPELKTLTEDGNRASFAIEPLYPGYGMTLGNSLRRVILSSLGGAAITAAKIDGVSHEFSTIPHVKEDVVQILLNLKKVRFRVFSDEPQELLLTATGKGPVTAKSIKTSAAVEVVNPDQIIATLDTEKAKLGMELRVEQGRGYVPVEAREGERLEVGMIALDAIYSPVQRVRYNVENTRVGQVTNLDRLVIEIETDGTISPPTPCAPPPRSWSITLASSRVRAPQSRSAAARARPPRPVRTSPSTSSTSPAAPPTPW